ncbi:MAG TPA: tetratricopeptide repeat protein [Pyrinomonadaceae bacterium]
MASSNKKLIQKSITVVVILAILQVAGVSPILMLWITGIIFVVWVVSRRSQNKQIEQIFNFYVAADAILRDDERQWYGFEVVEVIDDGERVFGFMADCPALHLFALGALYHRIGKYDASAEYLTRVLEDELYDERQNTMPSTQLRRYVSMLRRLETNPALAPQTLAAVRSLERMRRRQAARLLEESRAEKPIVVEQKAVKEQTPVEPEPAKTVATSYPMSGLVVAPPPIAEVLHDVYQDDQSPLN